jgi:Mce-associated membrane protein
VTTVNRWLAALVVVLTLVALLGAALVGRTHGDRADALVREQRYGDVLAAADAEVTAFVNLRYDQASRSIDAVAAGATGDFRAHYVRSARHVVEVLRRHRSTMTGQVVWSGVVAVAPDRATVIAATTGTVSNTSTHGEQVPRHFRLRISLLHQDGRWLTSDIQFVGDAR